MIGNMIMKHRSILLFLLLAFSVQSQASRCLVVFSYHQGYEWNDGIEHGIDKILANRCEIKKIYLDSKRNSKVNWIQYKAREAYEFAIKYKPDVIIAVDDNASKYLVMPYFRNKKTPIVFCGLNWTIEEYGYPYSNTTGMVEVSPMKAMLKQLRIMLPSARKGIFLSDDTVSEHKNYKYYAKYFQREGIRLDSGFVGSMQEWKQRYLASQGYDFMILGNNASINDWYRPEMVQFVQQHQVILSLTTSQWMLPYTAYGITKVPEEQGDWAGKAARSILDGVEPAQIPIVGNNKSETWVNPLLMQKLNIHLPRLLYLRVKQFRE